MKNVTKLMVAATLFVAANAWTQEKNEQLDAVVVTATKFRLKKEKTGKVIYSISKEEIERNAGKTVLSLLNTLPGVEVSGVNNTPGENKETYIRGGRSKDFVVLIDGVPVSDASGIGRSYDLRLLSLHQIEKIEVMKGAASTLYGSGAATGVISITLKKASKQRINGTYQASIGTSKSSTNSSTKPTESSHNATLTGTVGSVDYFGSFGVSSVKGMSAAVSATGASFEKDAFYSKNAFVRLGYQAHKKLKMHAFLQYDAFTYDFDAGAYQDSSVNKGDQTQTRVGVQSEYNYGKGTVLLTASLSDLERTFDSFNSFSNEVNPYAYNGKSVYADLVHKYVFSSEFQLISGASYQRHENETVTVFGGIDPETANFNTIDPYASLVYTGVSGINVHVGGRLNMHSMYGAHFVYDSNVSYHIKNTKNNRVKLITSYGTAFIAPSLYQLYSFAGNTELKPESSRTFEVGIVASHKKWLRAQVVYFSRNTQDAIMYQNLSEAPWAQYRNGTETSKVDGVEALLVLKPIENTLLKVGYTYTHVVENADYIPAHKLTSSLVVNALKNTTLSIDYKNVGKRTYFDAWGSFGTAATTVDLPAYSLYDFSANYKAIDGKVTFFTTFSNLFNEKYEDVLGYTTRGRNYKLGIRLEL